MGAASTQVHHPASASSSPHVLQVGSLQITPARTGDHLGIHQLLQEVFRGPSQAEFQLQQDEPGYAPSLRLVCRDGQAIVGHARVSPKRMLLGGQWLPVARVFDLCVRSEYRKRGVASHLLQGCDHMARERGAALMLTKASCPALFERLGWFPCGRNAHYLAGPREVLAEIERRRWEEAARHQPSDDLPQLSRSRAPLTVRRWKQTEHAAVQRLYLEATADLNGPMARDDEYWRWLIARQAFDWFYVAIHGPDRTLFDDIQGNIVGYMFIKDNRIVELMASLTDDRAIVTLLARACREAIEHSATPLRVDLPAGHAIAELLCDAGAKRVTGAPDGEAALGKVIDLSALAAAALAGTVGSARLSLEIRDEAATIPLYRAPNERPLPARWMLEHGKLLPDSGTARPQLSCSLATLVQLFVGHNSLSEAVAARQLKFNQTSAQETLAALLPRRPLWLPSLDELLA